MRAISIFLIMSILTLCCPEKKSLETIPVIYSTDLYHPPMDPDDHFDLACLFAIKEFDVKSIIIDNAAKAPSNPGIIPIRQMEKITGRTIPFAVGLKHSLNSPEDDGSARDDQRDGVSLILRILEESEKPVTIITVGSLRDIGAAFNARPGLFRSRVGRIFIFAGDASVNDPAIFREYNVDLDTLAFATIMNSGLNIYWVPCFDGGAFRNNGRASYICARREKLLTTASLRLMNYFRYAFLATIDSLYVDALDFPADSSWTNTIIYRQENGMRNLWCSHVFPYIARRNYIQDEGDCYTMSSLKKRVKGHVITPFIFRQQSVRTDADGMVTPDTSATGRHLVNIFEICDKDSFTLSMTAVVSHLLKELDTEPVKSTGAKY